VTPRHPKTDQQTSRGLIQILLNTSCARQKNHHDSTSRIRKTTWEQRVKNKTGFLEWQQKHSHRRLGKSRTRRENPIRPLFLFSAGNHNDYFHITQSRWCQDPNQACKNRCYTLIQLTEGKTINRTDQERTLGLVNPPSRRNCSQDKQAKQKSARKSLPCRFMRKSKWGRGGQPLLQWWSVRLIVFPSVNWMSV
jgi:hypothetical protein